MIKLNRSNTHVNGESVDTIEVWRREKHESEFTLVFIIPIDADETVMFELGGSDA